MNFHLIVICFATLLIRSSFEENNASTKNKKYNPEQSTDCPKECKCSTVATHQSDFLLHSLPKILRTVNCSNKGMLKIPSRIPSNTQSLILFDNCIKDAHRTVPEMTDLVYLDLSKNKIQNLGRGIIFKRLKKLKILNLSENNFKVLFAKVFAGLTSLEELTICNTKLGYIDEFAFERLYRLTHLYLRSNQLVYVFQEWFQDMDRLQVLDLSYNHIKFVSANSFMHLSTLFELDLRGNGIKGFSNSALNGLSYLKKLKLNQNNLSVIPQKALKSLTGLKYLDISENPIEKVSKNDLSNCTVQIVKLNRMPKLKLISSKAFCFLPNLTQVELNNNTNLVFIDASAFYRVNTRLKSVAIRNSGLQVLLSNTTSAFSAGTKLDIKSNPFRCDCNIKWLLNALRGTEQRSTMVQIVNSSEIRCRRPFGDESVSLLDLNPENISDDCPARTIRLTDSEVKVEARKSVALECRATGLPQPVISWVLPDGEELDSGSSDDRVSVLEDGCLQFSYTVLQDQGEYACVATNDLGRSTTNITLKIVPIDLSIHVNRVSATFVSVIWNGTARSAYNTYKLLCKEKKSPSTNADFFVVPVSPFDRFYTISNLTPNRAYIICIAIEDGLPANKLDDQIVSCMNVTTSDVSVILSQVSGGHSNVAVGVSLGIGAMAVIVLCLAYMAAKKYRHSKYKDPDEDRDKINDVSQIQLEALYSPLISPVGQQ